MPIWRLSNGPAAEKDVIGAVEKLLDEGFKPSNLVVLCSTGGLVSKLRERSVGRFSFGQWGGRGIPVETISRFKGLEAQAVVLAISAVSVDKDVVEAYVGMSRGRSILVVIGDGSSRQSLNWQS